MRYVNYILFAFFAIVAGACEEGAADVAGATGQGGSMTRFAIHENSLFAVSNTSLVVYDISNGGFTKMNEVTIGWNIETIFTRYPYLYMGSNEAMYIYSIQQPNEPSYVFRYSHIRSCDPVVVSGARAYVTMRNGSMCNEGNNALEILDISDPDNTKLVANYPMSNPHGLGVNGNLLFLCEGEYGFKVFDISNEKNIQLLRHLTDFHAYDVIVRDSWIAVTGEDGIFQFQYPDEADVIKLTSKIPVVRN